MKLKIGNYASYLSFDEDRKVAYTEDLYNDINIDFDEKGNIIGIEFLFEIKPEYYDDYKFNKK